MFSGKLRVIKRLFQEISRGNTTTLQKIIRLVDSELRPNNGRYKRFKNSFFTTLQKQSGPVLVYLIPGFNYGGAEITDYYLVRELSKRGFSIYLLGTDVNYESKVWFSRFEQVVHRAIWLPDYAAGFANQADFIQLLIEQVDACVLFNRNSGTGYRMLPTLTKQFPSLRLVDLIHTHDFGNDWISYSSATSECLHRRFVTNRDLLNYCLENSRLPAEKHEVIYCGTDTDTYPDLSERSAIRSAWLQEHGLTDDIRVVTYFGRFAEQKNPLRWLNVATHLARLDPAIHFLMAGDGELLDQTKQAFEQANLLGRATFTGRVDSAIPIACATDVLLLTSLFEGLPTVCFEFLMMGVPVLSTDVGGTRECLSRQETGAVFPLTTDDTDIASRVMDYLPTRWQDDEPLRQMRRQHTLDNFSVSRMGERYGAALRQLLEAGN